MRQAGGLDGEERDLVGAPVVRVSGELAQGVVADHDVRPDLTDVCDQAADGLVQRSVDQAYSAAGGRGGVAGIGVAEQPRGPGAQDAQGLGEFGGSGTAGSPGGGDDRGAGTCGGVLGEHAAGEEGFVVRVGENSEQ